MGALKERLRSRNRQRVVGQFHEALWEELTAETERIDGYLEQDRDRDSATLIKRYIDLVERGYSKAANKVIDTVLEDYYRLEELRDSVTETGLTPAELVNRAWVEEVEEHLDDLLRMIDNPDIRYVIENTDGEWLRGMQQDLEDNFLYVEWGVQLIESRTPVRTYAAYSLGIAALALVRLLIYNREGYELLQTVADPPLSKHDTLDLIREFHDEFRHLSGRPHLFYAELVRALPWTHDLIEALLKAYGNAVRTTRELRNKQNKLHNLKQRIMDSPLPDDVDPYPDDFIGSFEDVRLEQAISEYRLGGSAKEVADKYGIAQKAFSDELRQRGLMRSRGGARSGAGRRREAA